MQWFARCGHSAVCILRNEDAIGFYFEECRCNGLLVAGILPAVCILRNGDAMVC